MLLSDEMIPQYIRYNPNLYKNILWQWKTKNNWRLF